MYNSFKGRSIDLSKKVRVYRNLNNGTLSVMQNGLVVGHTHRICLNDVKFIVNQKGRERVLREGRKNVHAFIEGFFIPVATFKATFEVVYNPYNNSSFILKNDNDAINSCDYVDISSDGKIFAKGVHKL